MTALTLYGSNVAATTVTTACKLSTTTGGTEVHVSTTAPSDSSTNYLEIRSQTSTATDSASLPAPTGKGWLWDVTTLEGNNISAGNWSASIGLADELGGETVDVTIRFYKRSSGGTYTSIGSITVTAQSLSSSRSTVSVPATSMSLASFTTGDKLYIDAFAKPSGGSTWTGDIIDVYVSNSGTAGVATDFVITTPGYVVGSTTVTKTLASRFLLRVQNTKTLATRFLERVKNTKTLQTRFLERVKVTKTLASRFLERVGVTKTLQTRFLERVQRTVTLQARFILQKVNTTKTLTFRFLERVGVTKTLQYRIYIRTLKTLTLQTRFILRKYTLTLQFRALLRTIATKTLQVRALISTKANKTLLFRFLERIGVTKTLQTRTLLRTIATKTLQTRTLLRTNVTRNTLQTRIRLQSIKTATLQFRALIALPSVTKTLQARIRLRSIKTATLQFRLRLSGSRLLSGGFAVFANGTGTAQIDSFRATQFPDPALSLAPIIPRVGATSVLWNSILPINTTLGIDISLDGVNWTDVTSGNGGMIPSIFSQPDPVVDGFRINTSANYTNTNRTGGATATPTFDTSNSRVILTGGTNAIYLYTAIIDNDIDFFVDMDQSDAGGMVWRFVDANNYYYLTITDSLTSISTPNRITVYKVASNVQTQIGVAQITYTVGTLGNAYRVNFTRGTYHRFRVTMLGSIITVYVDGVQLITYTDGSPLASGKMGLYNNGGIIGSRYYQLWMIQIGDYVTGIPSGDVVTGKFVYTRLRLATTDASVSPQVLDLTTNAFTPNIAPGATIPAITYNNSFISKNFDDLAKQSNFSWYIDPNKNLIFRAGATVPAPWILQSAPAGLVQTVDIEVDSDFEVDVANDLYRNRQIILGAINTGPFTEAKVGDGSTRTFTLGNPLASIPVIVVNGVTQTKVGLKGTTGFDWYYAIADPVILQDASKTVLQNSDNIIFSYVGQFIQNVTVDNIAEQVARAQVEGGTGIVESVEDHTSENLTLAAATTLANQLLARYTTNGRTLVFRTSRNGLQIGQTLSIFFPEHNIIDGQFLITQIEIYLQKGLQDTQIWWYKVTCSELPKQDSWAKLMASGLGLQ